MNNHEILSRAEKYLTNRRIDIVKPGEFGLEEDDKVEVIFLSPLSLEPGVVMDPPDVRVWVNIKTGEVTLIDQM